MVETMTKDNTDFSYLVNDIFTYGSVEVESIDGTKVHGKNLEQIDNDIVKVLLITIIISLICLNIIWVI